MDFLFGKNRHNDGVKIEGGLEFDGFRLIRKVGTGGMGEVWLAKQISMERDVAIKMLSPKFSMDNSFIDRFMQEVRTTALLFHPNIVQAFHAGNFHGLYYLAVAYIDGVNLGDRLQIDKTIPEAQALKIMRAIAEALKYAWNEHKLMHRDLKPGNIMIDFDGHTMLMDFGISKCLNDEDSMMTMNNAIVGTPYYMSPEQARSPKDLDCRADIYSFGATLFHLVVGDLPFNGDSTVAVLTKLITEEMPPARKLNPNVSEHMENLLSMLMTKDRADRIATWEKVIENIDKLLGGLPPVEKVEKKVEEPVSPNDRTVVLNFDGPQPTRTIEQTKLSSMGELHKDNLVINDENDGHEVIVGIDLGTTFSSIAWVNPQGNVEVLPNSDGYATTPSVLFFDGEDVVLVGREAVQSSLLEPEHSAECFKRNIGESAFSHKLLGQEWHPEFLSAFVLKKLKQDAEEKLGPIRNAVITVPAYFDDRRRKATQDAGVAAGLNVVDIINEPSAAALWYGYKHNMENAAHNPTFLIYDLGGGTFDATLMQVNENLEFVTIATDGDVSLGGKDWDLRLLNHVAEEVISQTGMDPRENDIVLQELSQAVEQSKRALSKRNSVNIPITIAGQNLRVKIDREKFRELTADLLLRTETTVELLMEEADMDMKDLVSVIAVGGSSRMPMVRDMLEKLSGKAVDTSLDADLAVVQGAAVYAAALRAKGAKGKDVFSHEICHKLSEIKHCSVNSHSLGVETEGEDGPMNYIIIPRNTAIPCQETSVFGTVSSADDEMRSILINILEGESVNPEACVQIGTCLIDDLPADLPAESPVEVTFSYLENGRIQVSARAVDVGAEVDAQIVRGNNMLSNDLLNNFKDKLANIEVV
jgi:molecular chaperone DnaK